MMTLIRLLLLVECLLILHIALITCHVELAIISTGHLFKQLTQSTQETVYIAIKVDNLVCHDNLL